MAAARGAAGFGALTPRGGASDSIEAHAGADASNAWLDGEEYDSRGRASWSRKSDE